MPGATRCTVGMAQEEWHRSRVGIRRGSRFRPPNASHPESCNARSVLLLTGNESLPAGRVYSHRVLTKPGNRATTAASAWPGFDASHWGSRESLKPRTSAAEIGRIMTPPSKPRIRVMPRAGASRSRLFAAAFLQFYQRITLLQVKLFDGDGDLVIITGAIALATIEGKLRDRNFKDRYGDMAVIIGMDGQRGCNVLSIAAATGLPRETVRRKVARLVEMGIVLRRGVGDYILVPGVAQSPPFAQMIADLFNDTVRFVNECLAEGVLDTLDSTTQSDRTVP